VVRQGRICRESQKREREKEFRNGSYFNVERGGGGKKRILSTQGRDGGGEKKGKTHVNKNLIRDKG